MLLTITHYNAEGKADYLTGLIGKPVIVRGVFPSGQGGLNSVVELSGGTAEDAQKLADFLKSESRGTYVTPTEKVISKGASVEIP